MNALRLILQILLIVSSTFLIGLVLIQRGKGGGLAGAFGGVGGSSAFGTKAGDVFTKITIVTASIWFVLAMLLVVLNNRGQTTVFQDASAETSLLLPPVEPGAEGTVPPAVKSDATATPATAKEATPAATATPDVTPPKDTSPAPETP